MGSSSGLNFLSVLVIFITAITIFLYKYSMRNFDYWQKRNIPFVKPLKPFFGNFYDVFAMRSTIGDFLSKCYNDFKTPYFGIFVLNNPSLVIKDPELIKAVLVKDFNHFYDRNTVSDEKLDPISANMLFVAKNPHWKMIRNKMTPVFTTGKIKTMLNLINGVADELKSYINKNLNKECLESKEVCAKYSTDVIATCAFGISANSFENENAEFRVIGRKMFDFHWKTAIRQTSYFLAPILVKVFRMPFLDPTVTSFMREAFWATILQREKSKSKRNDLVDTIIKIKDQSTPNDPLKFEGDRVVAQAGQFFVAGFETVASTMSFTLYELCLNPNIQHKLRSEIKSVISKHGELTYEALQDMKYLHMTISETLRKYPVLPFLDRMCMMDYKIPGSDIVIDKGTAVYIPMMGLHYDPEYFPEPEKYDPERFSDENKQKFPSFSYLPFGNGPRNCIGDRFGLLVTKLGIAHVLLDYEVEIAPSTPIPIKFITKSFLLASEVGLPMKFKKVVSLAA